MGDGTEDGPAVGVNEVICCKAEPNIFPLHLSASLFPCENALVFIRHKLTRLLPFPGSLSLEKGHILPTLVSSRILLQEQTLRRTPTPSSLKSKYRCAISFSLATSEHETTVCVRPLIRY